MAAKLLRTENFKQKSTVVLKKEKVLILWLFLCSAEYFHFFNALVIIWEVFPFTLIELSTEDPNPIVLERVLSPVTVTSTQERQAAWHMSMTNRVLEHPPTLIKITTYEGMKQEPNVSKVKFFISTYLVVFKGATWQNLILGSWQR